MHNLVQKRDALRHLSYVLLFLSVNPCKKCIYPSDILIGYWNQKHLNFTVIVPSEWEIKSR